MAESTTRQPVTGAKTASEKPAKAAAESKGKLLNIRCLTKGLWGGPIFIAGAQYQVEAQGLIRDVQPKHAKKWCAMPGFNPWSGPLPEERNEEEDEDEEMAAPGPHIPPPTVGSGARHGS